MAIMTHDQFVQQYGRPPSSAPLSGGTGAQPEQQPQTLGQKIGGVAQGITNFVGAKGIADEFGASLAHATAPASQKNYVDFPSNKQVIGSAIQSGANLIPGAGEMGAVARIGAGAGAGYAMDVGSNLQQNKANPLTPGAGAIIGGGLPVVGATVTRPAARVVGRLLKGLGSGLSGASAKNLEAILANPKAAQKAQSLISKSGGEKILEDNSKTIVHGVSQVRQGARAEFGQAMHSLGESDIHPQTFRQTIQPVLDKFGVSTNSGARSFDKAEFSDPKNVAKASALVNELSTAKLDGKSLHSLMNKVEDSKYKTATSDERLSFNAFLNDLHHGIKNAVTASTDKLDEANKKYSHAMGLSQAVEGVFGKVKYKNFPEMVKASKKLETMFNQSGLEPKAVDEFLTKIGVDPTEFKAGEAVRQIGQKEGSANAPGFTLSEVTRAATSAVLTPEMVGRLTTATGLTRNELSPLLRKMKTPARNALIQALLQAPSDSQQ